MGSPVQQASSPANPFGPHAPRVPADRSGSALGGPRRDPRAPGRAESDLPGRESSAQEKERRDCGEIDAGEQLFSAVFGDGAAYIYCARNFSIQTLI